MPLNAPFVAGSIPEKALPPHLRRKGRSGGSVIIATNPPASARTYELGETFTAIRAAYLGSDGKLYLASATDDKPAIGLVKTAGASGGLTELIISGVLNLPDKDLTIGGEVYLNASTDNTTQTHPTRAAGVIRQSLGVAVSSTEIVVRIGEAEYYG